MSENPQQMKADTSNPQHHPVFYLGDGSAVFELITQPGILYRIHSSILTTRSEIFNSMFSLQHSAPGTRLEGVTDNHPILLPLPLNCTALDFDNLLVYLYKGPSEHPKSSEFLISVLQLSTFFQLDDGVAYAITEFERKGSAFDPALQFQLARMFRVDDWIEPAFRALMELPDSSLDLERLHQIGEMGSYHLIQTKDKIRKNRARLAFGTPKLRGFTDCNTPGSCEYNWKAEWWGGFARLIHHPDFPLGLGEIPSKLMEVRKDGIDGVCEDCLHLTIDSILADGKLSWEVQYIEEAILELMEYQTDEPVRAKLREIVTT
ncbi:hypothetical protein B0H11DRAFT_1804821 [Mycena galericulata]|nr:hypothetical protein B0H11DRAFT_1804821 [Mycena galericulata]